MSTSDAIIAKIGEQTFDKMAPEHAPRKFELSHFDARTLPVNSTLVRDIANVSVAAVRVRQRKLLGMGTRDQLLIDICAWWLKLAKVLFFVKSGAYCGAHFVR